MSLARTRRSPTGLEAATPIELIGATTVVRGDSLRERRAKRASAVASQRCQGGAKPGGCASRWKIAAESRFPHAW